MARRTPIIAPIPSGRRNGDPPVDSAPVSTPVARLGAAIAGTLLVLTLAAPVLAHAELVDSSPEDGAVLDVPPTEVVLRFTEPLLADRSSFRLIGPDGDIGTGEVDPDAPRVMRLGGLTLAPGEYEVRYTVGTDDGHVERERISFTVAAATGSPSTAPSAPPSDAPSTAPSDAPSAPPSDAPSAEPTAAPSASAAPSVAPSASPGPDDAPVSGSGTDVLFPIVIGLLLAAGAGAYVLRRNRSA